MNKIFKVIWNPATGSYTVASETAKSRGKKSGRSKLLISATGCWGNVVVVWGTGSGRKGQRSGRQLWPWNRKPGWVAIGEDAKANSFTDTGVAPAPQ